jgi:hypothetical protein
LTITDNKEESYCAGEQMWSLIVTEDDMVLAGVMNKPLRLIDRKKQVIK